MPGGKGLCRTEDLCSLEAYNALPPDVQKALDMVGLAMEPLVTLRLLECDKIQTQKMIDEWDNVFTHLPDDEWVEYLAYSKIFRVEEAEKVSPLLKRMFEIYEARLPEAMDYID